MTWATVGEVATWKSHCGQKRGRDMKLISRHRFVSRKVATWLGLGRRNDVATPMMSRHGVAWVVSRHRFDVATWSSMGGVTTPI